MIAAPPPPARRRKALLAGVAALVVAGGTATFLLSGDDDTGGAGGARPGVSVALRGDEVASADFDEYSYALAMPNGLLVNTYDGAVVIDKAGEEVQRFDTSMSVAANGAAIGFNYSDGEYVYWVPGAAPVITDVGTNFDASQASDDLRLAVVNGSEVTVYDITSGNAVWTGDFGGGSVYSLAWAGDVLAAIDDNSELQLLRVGSSTPIEVANRFGAMEFAYVYQMGDEPVDSSRLLVVDDDYDLVVLNPANGEELWSGIAAPVGEGGSPILQVNGDYWIGDQLIDAADGHTLWSAPSRYNYCNPWGTVMVCAGDGSGQDMIPLANLDAEPVHVGGSLTAIVDGVAYTITGDSSLDAVDTGTGDRRWPSSADASAGWSYQLVVTASQVVTVTSDDELVVLRKDNGEEVSNWGASVRSVESLIGGGDVLYVIEMNYDGDVVVHILR